MKWFTHQINCPGRACWSLKWEFSKKKKSKNNIKASIGGSVVEFSPATRGPVENTGPVQQANRIEAFSLGPFIYLFISDSPKDGVRIPIALLLNVIFLSKKH